MLWSYLFLFCEDILYAILLFSAKFTAYVYQHALSLCVFCVSEVRDRKKREKESICVVSVWHVYLQQKIT